MRVRPRQRTMCAWCGATARPSMSQAAMCTRAAMSCQASLTSCGSKPSFHRPRSGSYLMRHQDVLKVMGAACHAIVLFLQQMHHNMHIEAL